jgi:hypothetical protein
MGDGAAIVNYSTYFLTRIMTILLVQYLHEKKRSKNDRRSPVFSIDKRDEAAMMWGIYQGVFSRQGIFLSRSLPGGLKRFNLYFIGF